MSQSRKTLLLGAVAYDPKVVTIWEGFRDFFAAHELDFDVVLFTNYERQVLAHLDGAVDVAWNSPLAWLQFEAAAARRGRAAAAIAMRDSDRDLSSYIVVREGGGVGSLAELRGKTIAVGASDSPQATMIPLQLLREQGLQPGRDVEVRRFDVLVGKHGDHIGGERDAARALMAGEVAAACMIDGNHLLFAREGVLPAGSTKVLAQTPPYDHCNFSVFAELQDDPRLRRFVELLLGMSYADAAVRPLMDLEGLKQWLPGRISGYAQLERACAATSALAPLLALAEGLP
ncbi:MAG: phosphate/phosphite/phosphonate ABC transporter substrate-binding protein [Nannocystaceae bacterium]|nr:phosphate/phosphite/phosphonate ABC transporter substrate-binding protein [Nannocystaceae bacterium]